MKIAIPIICLLVVCASCGFVGNENSSSDAESEKLSLQAKKDAESK